MRIACTGRSAADRIALQKLVEDSYAQCRSSIGHLSLAHPYPASVEEVLVNAPPAAVLIGPQFSVDEACAACREVRAVHPSVPILVFLAPEKYSLRSLRRLEHFCFEVFSTQDPPTRVVHRLNSFAAADKKIRAGKIITVAGAKGGVGATSIVSGLAHAAQALGLSAVVVDLSASSSFAHYMAAARWQSPDYTAALVDGLAPDERLIERCLITAPNNVSLLLPPSGGSDVRDLWLRDSARFEISLSVVDLLTEMFDVVLVDLAAAEGVLQFALQCRAFCRLLITANDAASVHLLSNTLGSAAEVPGAGNVRILINNVFERALLPEDVLDFLFCSEHFQENMLTAVPMPHDPRARHWIGTGNSFYTEGGRAVQQALECILGELLGRSPRASAHPREGLLSRLRDLTYRPRFRCRLEAPQKALPAPEPLPRLTPRDYPAGEHPPVPAYRASAPAAPVGFNGEINPPPAMPAPDGACSSLYQPPKLQEPPCG